MHCVIGFALSLSPWLFLQFHLHRLCNSDGSAGGGASALHPHHLCCGDHNRCVRTRPAPTPTPTAAADSFTVRLPPYPQSDGWTGGSPPRPQIPRRRFLTVVHQWFLRCTTSDMSSSGIKFLSFRPKMNLEGITNFRQKKVTGAQRHTVVNEAVNGCQVEAGCCGKHPKQVKSHHNWAHTGVFVTCVVTARSCLG